MRLRSIIRNWMLRIFGVSLLPSIKSELIDELSLFFYQQVNIDEFDGSIFNSIMSEDQNIRILHNDFINEMLANYLNKIIVDYKVIVSTFFAKKSNVRNEVGPHPDPTGVDFTKDDDFTIWIPLIDANRIHSGRIRVLLFSHLLYSKLNFVQNYFCHDYLKKTFINKLLLRINLKKGNPIIFYNRLIHASEINKIYTSRLAISIKLTKSSAKLVSYHVVNWERREVSMYFQNDSYYVRNGWDERNVPIEGLFYQRVMIKKI